MSKNVKQYVVAEQKGQFRVMFFDGSKLLLCDRHRAPKNDRQEAVRVANRRNAMGGYPQWS